MPDFHETLQTLGAQLFAYGPPPAEGSTPCMIAEDFGSLEAEYAAIRRHVALLHLPQTGLVNVTGEDRQDFLHRMVTQDVNAMDGGQTRRSFQLSADGKIVGDLHIHHGDANTWLELDRFDIKPVCDLLDSRLFSEDVTLTDVSDTREVFALLGPASVQLLSAVAEHTCEGMTPGSVSEMPGTTHVVRIGEALVSVCRRDLGSVLGLRLFVPSEHAAAVYRVLIEAMGFDADADPAAQGESFAESRRQTFRGRPIGWSAFNTARIEEALPIFHIDFGPDSQVAELGDETFRGAVSLTKGCYLGQEAVARMHNLSHPKRILTGLKIQGEHVPVAGTLIFEHDAEKRKKAPRSGQIGALTSSTLSPMLGASTIGIAMMKWGKHRQGTVAAVPIAPGSETMVDGEVCGLGFLGSGG